MMLDDIDDVHKIEEEAFPFTTWKKETYIHEVTLNNFAHYFVLEIDESIIGYIGMWIVIDDGQITTIAVKREYQGRGYAKKLMNFAMDYMQPPVKRVSLEVNVKNESAIKLYESLGFLYGGIRKDYYGPGMDAHVMWVNLDERH